MSNRAHLLTALRIAVAVVTLAAVIYAIAANWDEVSGQLGRISPGAIVLATALAGAGTWLTMLGWKVILGDLGSPLHAAPASGVYFVGQLGKYLPGSLWSVLVQADIASHLHIPRRRTAVAGLIALGFGLLTGGVFGLPAVHFLVPATSAFPWWTLLALPVVVLLVAPPLLNRLIGLLLKAFRRDPLEHELSTPAVLRAVGLFVLVWVCFGLHTYVLAREVAPDVTGTTPGRDLALAAICGYALAVSVGMLTVVLPAGLGARDGLLTLVLGAVMPLAAAGAVAIVSRFIVTVVDVLAAVAGWAYARSHDLLGRAASDDAEGTEGAQGADLTASPD